MINIILKKLSLLNFYKGKMFCFGKSETLILPLSELLYRGVKILILTNNSMNLHFTCFYFEGSKNCDTFSLKTKWIYRYRKLAHVVCKNNNLLYASFRSYLQNIIIQLFKIIKICISTVIAILHLHKKYSCLKQVWKIHLNILNISGRKNTLRYAFLSSCRIFQSIKKLFKY